MIIGRFSPICTFTLSLYSCFFSQQATCCLNCFIVTFLLIKLEKKYYSRQFFFFCQRKRNFFKCNTTSMCSVYISLNSFLLISAIVRSFFYYYIDLFLTYLFIINIFFIKQPIYLAGIFIYPLCYISGSFLQAVKTTPTYLEILLYTRILVLMSLNFICPMNIYQQVYLSNKIEEYLCNI